MNSYIFGNDSHPVLDPGLRGAVLPFAPKVMCKQGQELINSGEQAHCFYYIEKGTFEVSYTAQKTPIVVALIGTGSIFGEIGFFDGLTRTRNIRAVEDAEIRVFNQQVMDAVRSHDTGIYGALMEFLLQLVCYRFRQILTDRGPLSAYAASLSTGKEQFQGLQSLPADLLGSAGWQRVSRRLEDFKAALFDISYRLQKNEGADVPSDLQAEAEAVLEGFKVQVRQYGEGLSPDYIPLM